MKKFEHIITETKFNISPQDLLFDIETTGLSPSTARIYMMGVGILKQDGLHIIQWMTEKATEELTLIKTFEEFAKDYKNLIHYNGTKFDLPFVTERARQLEYEFSFQLWNSRDLYKEIYAYKMFFRLQNLKQKTVEEFLGILREDKYDGGQLIKVYLDYEKTHSEEAMQLVVTHNREDLIGLARIPEIRNYIQLFEEEFLEKPQISRRTEKEIYLSASLKNCFLPSPITIQNDSGYFIAKENQLKICLPIIDGRIRIYYPNYKEYFYLPKEDMAVHKSVAIYTDKAFREKATPKTCYTWYELNEDFLSNEEKLLQYIHNLLKCQRGLT